jgi:site-specific DNA-methyltransferase (adenine-specific)
MPISEVFNIDCMEYMGKVPDKYFELALVDPPYGINAGRQSLGRGGGKYRKEKKIKRGDWDKESPSAEYFTELIRVSKNQIIWGGNYFTDKLNPTPCYIFWDKNNGGSDFADGELAWSSFTSPLRKFKYTWSGFIQGNMKVREVKIHDTQKPIALYTWLLQNYAKPGDKILDTHLGSGSSRIAAYDLGFDFYATELDKDYYEAQEKRFQTHIKQQKLFTPESYNPIQLSII